tara:strand:+ start:199 stop:1761 length:1563 start_codon:yes stop_codon:yes gene_type:complete
MLTNETRRNILDRVKASGYPGGVSEAFRAAEQGVDVVDQFVKQQQQEQQQQQEMQASQQQMQGNEGMSQRESSPPPPPMNRPDGRISPPNVNQPIDNNQGHLVQSENTQNVGIQSLPTGSAQGQVIQAKNGGVRKYNHGGEHAPPIANPYANFQPDPAVMARVNEEIANTKALNESNTAAKTTTADALRAKLLNTPAFTPNYDQGSVSDNTNSARFQEDQSNFEEKESTLAKIEADKQYAETQAQLKAQKGTVFNTTKRTAGVALSNTMLTNQLAGGYGGSNMRKSLEAAPEKTEEIFKNTMRSSGMNTMRDIALGVTGVGASTKLAAGTNTLGTRILSYPTDKLAGGINSMITKPGVKNFIGSGLKSAYNYGLMTGMPDVIGGVGEAGVNYATGKQSGVSAFKDAALKISNFVPAIRGFNNLGWVANNYGKIKNLAKGANDFSEGKYLTGITRQFGNSGNPIINYGSKAIKKFIPKSWESSLGIRTATGGQITPPGLNFKEGGVRYSRRKMGYVSKNIL